MISSRENLKQYLITGKVDENTPISNLKTAPCLQSLTTLPISEDFSTESPKINGENTSITKNEENRKPMKLVSNVKLNKYKENLKTQPDETNSKKTSKINGVEKKPIRTPVMRKTMPSNETSILKKERPPPNNHLKKSSIDFNFKRDKKEEAKTATEKKVVKPGLKKMSSSMSTTDFSSFSKKTESRKTLGSIADLGRATMIKKK